MGNMVVRQPQIDLEYSPITTTAMCQLWAQACQQGQLTAGDKTIDGDMILVDQA
jgi:hypothetical protein